MRRKTRTTPLLKAAKAPQSEITACKRAEEAMRQNEQRMCAILDGALDAVVEMDVQGTITQWNPRAETIFGWTRSEAVGRQLSATIIPPQYREAHARGLRHFLATGEGPILNQRIEITASRRDGTEFPVELTVTAITLGNSHRFTAFINDITTRKHAEKALRESEERLRVTYDHAPVGICEADFDGRFVRMNQRFCDITGYTQQELLTRRFQDITHPDDVQTDVDLFRRLQKMELPFYNMEKRYIHKDGRIIWIELHVSLVRDAESRALFGIGVVQDITTRKLAEEALHESKSRFRLVMDHANDAIVYLDLNGMIQWASLQTTVLTGRPMAELVGRPVMSVLTPGAADAAGARLAAVRRGEAVPPLVEFAILRPDGKVVVVEANITGIQGAKGMVGRLLVLRDVTERKRAEEEHRGLYERLQDSHLALRALSRRLMEVQEEERHHIARELHDEIGQALTVVKINIQQAMHALGEPTAGTHLVESVSLLDHTLQQVRNLALDLRPSLLDDLGLVPTLTWLAERHSRASEIAVQVSAESLDIRPAPEIELACYRVAQEALTNAARHARASQVHIELARSGRELVLLIRDNGIGFDITTMLSRAAEGKSIGLLGMQERVTLTGGEMEIFSSPGQGTEIRARFPLDAHSPSQDKHA